MFEKLKALLVKAGLTEADVAVLDEPEVEVHAAAGGTDEMAGLKATIAEQATQIKELIAGRAADAATAHRSKVEAMINSRVVAGIVTPGQATQAMEIAMSLPVEGKVKVFAADGTSKEGSALDAYLASLDRDGSKVRTNGQGMAWVGSEDPDAQPQMTADELKAIAATAR